MSVQKTCEEWHQWGGVHPKEVLWDWQNDRVELQARADSRLELLIELEDRVLKCPSCGRLRDGHGLLAHADGCELAKELDDG